MGGAMQILNRILLAAALIAGLSTDSSAATLAVSPDTLTVIGDDQGTSAYAVFGRLDYSGALVDNGTRTQTKLIGPGGSWVTGLLSNGDNGVSAYSWAFNQAVLTAQTATNLPGTL